MSVNISNPVTEAKIRKLAKRTGESLTQTVDRAVSERLAATPSRRRRRGVDRKRLADVIAYFNSLPRINEELTDDEIIG